MTAKIEPKAFFDLPFENGKKITDTELKAAYDAGHSFIRIDLTDGHFAPEVTLFNGSELDRIRGGIIRIDNNSTQSILVAEGPSKKPEQLKAGYYYHASGTTGWSILIKPIN
ncbi:TPA: hypothetical protein ACXEMW_003231 [Proteus mirabilis]